jgi:RNA polymerase sigma-70 factor, ECF subfamily
MNTIRVPPAASIGTHINESHARALLRTAARGDQGAFARLYDEFAGDTYAVCAHYVPDQARLDETMMALWLHYWTDAPRFAAQTGLVREILITAAHVHAATSVVAA